MKIKSLAEENNMSLSGYILHNSLGKDSPKIIREITFNIRKMRLRNFKVENNINQLAKRVNSNDNLSKTDIEEFKSLFRWYENTISDQTKIIKKLIKIFLQ